MSLSNGFVCSYVFCQSLKSYVERSFGEVVYVPKGHGGDASIASGDNPSNNGDSSEHSNASTSSPISNSGHGFHVNANGGQSVPFTSCDAVRVFALLKVPAIVTQSDSSSCYALNERIVAAESCWFAAQMLIEAKPLLLNLLPSSDGAKCEGFISNYSLVMGQLRALLYKVNGPLLINYPQVCYLID